MSEKDFREIRTGSGEGAAEKTIREGWLSPQCRGRLIEQEWGERGREGRRVQKDGLDG